MSSSLAPSFLLSMPQLLDPNFTRTVVLLCKHSEEGAFGLVVNRPLVTEGPVVVEIRAAADAVGRKTEVSEHELQGRVGGAVEPQRSWILDGDDSGLAEERRGVRVADGVDRSASPGIMDGLLGRTSTPR